ncbi:ICLN protein, partial [Polyodon spathula]|nr:ICLN protein [Polyodon spathula]
MVLLKNVSPPSEGVRYQQSETAAVLDGKGLGSGTLYVAENRLSWFDGTGLGFSLEYPSISLHAISRDVSAYPQEHLYVMVNAKLSEEDGAAEESEMKEKDSEGEQDESDEDTDPITEIRFVPSDKAARQYITELLSERTAEWFSGVQKLFQQIILNLFIY